MKLGFNPAPETASPVQKEQLGKLKKLSVEFESFFMNEVIKSMRKTVQKGGLIDGGNSEEIYKSMQDEQWSMQIAKNGNSGLAQSIYNDLSQKYLASVPEPKTEVPK